MGARHRFLGILAAGAMGLALTGCVAYDDGYGPGYAGGGYYGGGYYGGGYGVTSVNVYAPTRYRHDDHYDRPRRYDRPRHYDGGHHDGRRDRRHERRQEGGNWR